MRLRYKLPLVFALTTLVFAGIVALVAALALRGVYLDRLESDMLLQAHQFAAVLEQEASASVGGDAAYLQALTDKAGDAGALRLTLIARDGTVLADSQVDPATLDNHADRPEVAQALAGNEGRARRESATLKQEEVYTAVPLPASDASWSEGVVRTALPANRVDTHGGRCLAGASHRMGGPALAHPGRLLSPDPIDHPAGPAARGDDRTGRRG